MNSSPDSGNQDFNTLVSSVESSSVNLPDSLILYNKEAWLDLIKFKNFFSNSATEVTFKLSINPLLPANITHTYSSVAIGTY